MIFTLPLAFLALLAIPALMAIYWLRGRFRRHSVSSLMLWMDQRQTPEGGTVIHRLQTPLPFFLELIAMLLLILAMAGPMVRSGERLRPLVVVLDDSYSMLAGESETARGRALAAIEEELRRDRHNPAHFVLAGESPQLLGEPTTDAGQAIAQLNNWQCLSPTANLGEAISFAFELGGKRARVLVLTDQAPPSGTIEATDRSPLQWWAFGRRRSNVAFVNASRTFRDGKARCLLEIANLSPEAARTTLRIGHEGAPERSPRSILDLDPNQTRRVVFELESGAPAVHARLSDDALGMDNQVILLPDERRPVPTEIRIQNERLRSLVQQAAEATQSVTGPTVRPELMMTDQDMFDAVGPETWTIQFIAEGEANAYLGPFIADRAHPLTDGLSLNGVVWGGGKTEQMIGTPVITAGNIPLLTDVQRATGRHDLRLRLRLDLSTLQQSPNWPILIWNLVAWRAGNTPGVRQPNLRLGAEATLTFDPGTESVRVITPQGNQRQLFIHDNTALIKAERAGVYTVRTNTVQYQFASNVLYRQESDLTARVSGRWGDWLDTMARRFEYQHIAWVFLLLALATLTAHHLLIAGGWGK